MVLGIERFKEWFQGYEDQYAIIGGTACDLLMAEEGLDFRGTKDIDLVLIVEAISPEFGRRFWEFVRRLAKRHYIIKGQISHNLHLPSVCFLVFVYGK